MSPSSKAIVTPANIAGAQGIKTSVEAFSSYQIECCILLVVNFNHRISSFKEFCKTQINIYVFAQEVNVHRVDLLCSHSLANVSPPARVTLQARNGIISPM